MLTVVACFMAFGNLKAQTDPKSTALTMYSSPKIVPATLFYDRENVPHALSENKGKVVLVNFWKTTCRLCLIELPDLNRLMDQYADKPFVVIAVAEDSTDAELIAKVLHDRRLQNIQPFYDQEERLLKAVGGEKVPRTILLNKGGQEVGYLQGLGDFTSPDIFAQIEALF